MPDLPTGTVTLLFTDIEGSTQLLQRLGPRYGDVLADYQILLRSIIQTHSGQEVDTQGDSFFVAFPRAIDAVLAAVAIQRALVAYPWPEGVTMATRMGLHIGEPLRWAEGYVGLDVHRAARIGAVGHGGQVLLSDATRAVVTQELPAGIGLRDLGRHQIKDLPQSEHIFQVVVADLPADFPPLKTAGSHPHNLPVQRDPLIGREREVAQVRELLLRADVGLVTLTGPGGIGKTRLALQVAAELCPHFVDGVFFVDLAPITDAALVTSTIAGTLGLQETAGRSLADTLATHLHDKRLLLALDNFEQVVDAAPLLAHLLHAAADLKLLLTSRTALQLRDEWLVEVPPLAVPPPGHVPTLAALSHYPAVRLFLRRAHAIKPDFALTAENVAAVAAMCARLDGVPLAIELAAARVRIFTPQALLERLTHPLQVLAGGARDLPPRQQTLRATIAWSYHLLDPSEQTLFRRLAVFVGGCTLDAAEAVCNAARDPGLDVLDGVQSLLAKSLLRQREQADGAPRLVMLETIHAYAREQLHRSDAAADTVGSDVEELRRQHADYFVGLAEQALAEVDGPAWDAWVQRLEAEHDNLRAVFRWAHAAGEPDRMLRLSLALHPFWTVRGHWREGRQWLDTALALPGPVPPRLRAQALDAVVWIAVRQSDRDARVVARAEESLALFRALGDERGIASALKNLGYLTAGSDDVRAARLLEEGLTRVVAVADATGIRGVMRVLTVLPLQVDAARITALLTEGVATFRERGDRKSLAVALNLLAEWLRDHGEYARAQALGEESLALDRELGDAGHAVVVYHTLSLTALLQGDDARAQALAEASVARARRMAGTWYLPWPLITLGYVAHHQAEYARAWAFLQESLALVRAFGHQGGIALCLAACGGVVGGAGAPDKAARLFSAAERIMERLHETWSPAQQREFARNVAVARAQADAVTWAAAWAEGRAMTLEGAVRYALAADAANGPASATSPRVAASALADASGAASAGRAGAQGGAARGDTGEPLTPRELEVLRLLAQGRSNQAIANELIVAVGTVKRHVNSLCGKLGAQSRLEAVARARALDIVE